MREGSTHSHSAPLPSQQTIQPPPSQDTVRSLVDLARQNLKQSRFTDAELIYTPSQIALASLRLGSQEGREIVEKYLEAKEGRAREAGLKAEQERESWRQKKSRSGLAQKTQEDQGEGREREKMDESIKRAPLGIPSSDINNILSEIERLVEERKRTADDDVELFKSIDKKVKLCQNPENLPMSRM